MNGITPDSHIIPTSFSNQEIKSPSSSPAALISKTVLSNTENDKNSSHLTPIASRSLSENISGVVRFITSIMCKLFGFSNKSIPDYTTFNKENSELKEKLIDIIENKKFNYQNIFAQGTNFDPLMKEVNRNNLLGIEKKMNAYKEELALPENREIKEKLDVFIEKLRAFDNSQSVDLKELYQNNQEHMNSPFELLKASPQLFNDFHDFAKKEFFQEIFQFTLEINDLTKSQEPLDLSRALKFMPSENDSFSFQASDDQLQLNIMLTNKVADEDKSLKDCISELKTLEGKEDPQSKNRAVEILKNILTTTCNSESLLSSKVTDYVRERSFNN